MKKQLVVLSAAAMVVAAAVPALALENEFHGMYKFIGYQSNFFNGTTFNATGTDASQILSKDAKSGFMAEQRARLQYIAKANDNLKLVTHFELDARFGGKNETYLGANNDAGNLDADQLTLETKNIYLDFNDPITGTNMKVGIQPWADAYQSLFLLADMSGVYATKKFDAFTGSLGWFRLDDNTAKLQRYPGVLKTDLFVGDGKFAVNKDIKIGGSYYYVQNDTGAAQAGGDNFDKLHMVGVNADFQFGPVNVKPFAAYQFGDMNSDDEISGLLAGAVTKTKVGSGAINLSAIYLSGDDNGTGKNKDFKNIAAANAQYFNPANMWLLVRNAQGINSSTNVTANDLTVGDRGFIGVFAGYEGKASDKIFYNANIGYAQTAEERGSEDGTIGTEINAQIGYKLFDNLSVSAAGAYLFLGDGMNDKGSKKISGFGGADADDPYMTNVQLSYTF